MTQKACLLFVLLLTAAWVAGRTEGADRVPILYSTDLFQPHDDPDDHYDLATLFALDELDIRGIVLDLGDRQRQKPGRAPIEQMFRLTGRKIPYATGLDRPLRSPRDKAFDQPLDSQRGVQLILDTLKSSEEKVTIFTTGSVRDVAAAFNRDPELLRRKVNRLYINIGNSQPGESEWNVNLDKGAYIGVLRSGLPVYWCPCFGTPLGTHWSFRQGDVLGSAPVALQNFLIFALSTGGWWKREFQAPPPAGTDDPIGFLFGPVDASVRERIWEAPRNMWCTGPLFHAAGRRVVELAPGRWAALPPEEKGGLRATPYDFAPGRLTVDDKALTRFQETSESEANVRCFRVLGDPNRYQEIMTSCLRELYRTMDVADPAADAAALPFGRTIVVHDGAAQRSFE